MFENPRRQESFRERGGYRATSLAAFSTQCTLREGLGKGKGAANFLLMFFLDHSTYNSDFHSITPSLTTTNTFAQYEQRNMLNLSVTTPINL